MKMKKSLKLHKLPLRGFWGKNWSVVSEDEDGESFEMQMESVEVASLTLARDEKLAGGMHVVKCSNKSGKQWSIEVDRSVMGMLN